MAVITNKRSVMTLYTGANDPHSHRVRIVLAEKGVVFDQLDIEDLSRSTELAELNPYQTVPTLVDRDLILFQSQIIMEYLDERFPHPPLMPVYPVARARSRLMMYRVERDWYILMEEILQGSPDRAELARKQLLESLVSVSPLFETAPYFLSEDFSLVDCCLAPLLWRLPMLKVKLPASAKAISDYAERLFARESFQASLTQAEKSMELA